MRWLSEGEKAKIRACIQGIEYPSGETERGAALVKLLGYLEGERQVAHGVSRAYHLPLLPLLYSIVQVEDADKQGQVRTALKLLDSIAVDCSKKHVSFLLHSDRFKLLVGMIVVDDIECAMLTSKVIITLLKIDDSIKELFWELHLHQVVRKALTNTLTKIKAMSHDALAKRGDLIAYTMSLLDVLSHSTGNVRHRQELYGSGYGMCNQLLNTMLALSTSTHEPIQEVVEKLVLTVALLVRENKLNQDDFRKQPKQGYLTTILTTTYSSGNASPHLKHAIELLALFLRSNEGVTRFIKEEIRSFDVDDDLVAFMQVMLGGLESLRKHHYDVDAVVRSLKVIEDSLISKDLHHDAKCYFFRNCHGAWPLLFLCLNNIDERIMYQACCLTARLVRDNPKNQRVLLEMDGIDTLSEILSDYNLDIQLVGLQILDALRGGGPHAKEIGDIRIVDYLLKNISQFPGVFSHIMQQHKSGGGVPSPCPTSPSVTTTLNPNPAENISSWEKQVSIVLYSLALIGDIVVRCTEVKSRLLQKSEDGLLQLLSSSYVHISSFYTVLKEQGGDAKDNLRTLIRARTAPGRPTLLRPESCSPEMANAAPAPPPLKKLSSSLVKVLLSVVEAACRALTNVVRHCPEAQWRFHKNGGTESVLSYVHCLVTFSEKDSKGGRAEHEAWRKVHSTPGEALQDITYVGKGLSVLQSDGEDLHDSGSTTVGKSMYLCQNGWLVDPEMVSVLLLLLVNTAESNREIQSALCDSKVRLMIHYLTSHPSNVVVNSALLLISHLCFNNSASQRYFATPYIVQRLQSLTAVSYIRLVQGTDHPEQGFTLPWTSEHLHLLTPPVQADPASFFAFQSLAYAYICLANLLQIYPAAVAVVVSARVHVNGATVEWTKLLTQSLMLPCYPIQDAAMTLLSNIVNGSSPQECAEAVDFELVDTLTRIIVMDRSADDTGSANQPSSSGDTEAERKWLGNKAFQLLLTMGPASTRYLVAHLRQLVRRMPQHADIDHKMKPAPNPQDENIAAPAGIDGYDEVDLYNAIVNYLPIVNGLTYSSESCRKGCLDCGCWDVITSLMCRVGIELDVVICNMYVMANMISHSKSVGAPSYARLVEGRCLDVLAKVVLRHPQELDGDEQANMNVEYIASIFQLACQLVLRVGSLLVDGVPSRQYYAAEAEGSSLLKLAEREARNPTSPAGQEAVSFILLLAEDDKVADTYIRSSNVQELLLLCLADTNLPQTTSMLEK